jgi:hypothetical protein
VDENLKSQPKQFWKYVASFRKRNSNSIQFEVDGKNLFKPQEVADEFLKHFQSVYNNPSPVVFPTLLSPSEYLPLSSVSDSDVIKAIKRLRPSKYVRVDDIPGFIIKGCTDCYLWLLLHSATGTLTGTRYFLSPIYTLQAFLKSLWCQC